MSTTRTRTRAPRPLRVRGYCARCRLLPKATPQCSHPTWHVLEHDPREDIARMLGIVDALVAVYVAPEAHDEARRYALEDGSDVVAMPVGFLDEATDEQRVTYARARVLGYAHQNRGHASPEALSVFRAAQRRRRQEKENRR
jgi:hypothetical protein